MCLCVVERAAHTYREKETVRERAEIIIIIGSTQKPNTHTHTTHTD